MQKYLNTVRLEERCESNDKIDALRKVLENDDPTFTIALDGSLARGEGEASDESDIDYFFFGDDDDSVNRATIFFKSKQKYISEIVGKSPLAEGAFGSSVYETRTALIADIDGKNDTNEKIKHRILFLLEGRWLTSKKSLINYRNAILNRYVSEHIKPHHLCRFLLNDIIRYYRTACVDLEFKTVEKNNGWGLRYIKLRYSKQLVYFSGLIAVAETAGLSRDDKINRLADLFDVTPTNRINDSYRAEATRAMLIYNNYLIQISDNATRSALNLVTPDESTHTENFKNLQQEGRKFTLALSKVIDNVYPSDHAIHNALHF